MGFGTAAFPAPGLAAADFAEAFRSTVFGGGVVLAFRDFGTGVGVGTIRGLPEPALPPITMTFTFGSAVAACLEVPPRAELVVEGVGQGVGPGMAPPVTLIFEVGGTALETGVGAVKGLGLVSVTLIGARVPAEGDAGIVSIPVADETGGAAGGAPETETVPRASGGTGI